MPNYDFCCDKCGIQEEKFFHMNEAKEAKCDKGHTMRQMVSNIYMKPDIQPYNDMTLGFVRSRKDKVRKMKEANVRPFDPTDWKGEPGTKKRQRYETYVNGIHESKDIYKHKIRKGDEVNANIKENVKSKYIT